MFPQQFQTSPFNPQGVWGAGQPFSSQGAWGLPQQLSQQGISLADIVNIVRVLPHLLQSSLAGQQQFGPQASFGSPAGQFGPQASFGSPTGQFGPQASFGSPAGQFGPGFGQSQFGPGFGQTSPMSSFQTSPFMQQGPGFGAGQFGPQGLGDVLNTIVRILPLITPQAAGAMGQQSGGFGNPYQQVGPQGVNPLEVINLIGRYLGQQPAAGMSTQGLTGVGSSPYVH